MRRVSLSILNIFINCKNVNFLRHKMCATQKLRTKFKISISLLKKTVYKSKIHIDAFEVSIWSEANEIE